MTAKGIQPAGAYEDVRSVQNKTKVPRVIKYLQPEEVNGLLDYVVARACLRDQAMVHVLLDAGVRISELVELDVGDVDFQTGELRVRRGESVVCQYPRVPLESWHGVWVNEVYSNCPMMARLCCLRREGGTPTSLVEPPDMRRVPGFLGSPRSRCLLVSQETRQLAALCWREGAVKRKWCAKGLSKTCASFARIEAIPQICVIRSQ